jgi:hypothetical protein
VSDSVTVCGRAMTRGSAGGSGRGARPDFGTKA